MGDKTRNGFAVLEMVQVIEMPRIVSGSKMLEGAIWGAAVGDGAHKILKMKLEQGKGRLCWGLGSRSAQHVERVA